MRKILLCSTFLFLPLILQAQTVITTEKQNQEIVRRQDFLENTVFEISEVNYNINGRTNPRILNRKLDYPQGKLFESKNELDLYMQNIRQQLVNFEFFSDIQVFYETIDTDGTQNPVSVIMTIAVKDELSFIILPGPKYNSNSGLSVKLKYKDNNFLGFMESVYTNLSFNQNYDDETKKQTPEIFIDMSFAFPFMMKNMNSVFTVDSDFSFQNIATEDFLFALNLNTQIEAEIFKNRHISLFSGFQHGFHINAQDSKLNLYEDDELYFSEKAYVRSEIPIVDTGYWGKVTYNPQLSLTYNWDHNGINSANTDLRSPQLTFSHDVSYGRIDHVGMFRKGFSVQVANSYTYNFPLSKQELSASATAKGYYNLFSHLGINSRCGFFLYLQNTEESNGFEGDTTDNRGDYIRGIRNHRIKSDLGIYFSLDLPIYVFSFNAQKIANTYFPNSKFMTKIFGAFGFDLTVSPFFDCMLTHYNNDFYADPSSVSQGDRYFSIKDGWYAGGVDFIITPHKFKSQSIRIGVAWDLEEVLRQKTLTGTALRDGESIYEIIFGLSLEY